ncbi:hypothetical protein OAM98_03770 [Schleiferiaceae bacterium]|nr:hypothetical protein [Schleiferiaceae bacterium]
MNYYRISKRHRFRYLGSVLITRAILNKGFNLLFRRKDWHYRTPYGLRGYQKVVRDLLLKISEKKCIVFDYGCGHGHLSQGYKRVLFDIDKDIVNHYTKEKVYTTKEELGQLGNTFKNSKSVCLFLNWPHGLTEDEFLLEMEWLFSIGFNYIITDLLFSNYRIDLVTRNKLVFKGDMDRDILLLWA